MAIVAKRLIGIALFTVLIVSLTLRDPLASVGDYSPAIRNRCAELKLIEDTGRRLSTGDVLRKAVALLVFVFVFAIVLAHVNGASTFWEGFRDSYLIWLVIDWYDALVLDCMWFCHSKRIRIPGTEDMDEEYRDYLFHILRSCKGMLLGLPACITVGIICTVLP